jgi:hypothetical protein
VCAENGVWPYDPTPTDNPYYVDHGYGYTYAYQPVFTPVDSNGSTPTPPPTTEEGLSTETWIIIGLVAVIIVILIAFGVYATRRK